MESNKQLLFLSHHLNVYPRFFNSLFNIFFIRSVILIEDDVITNIEKIKIPHLKQFYHFANILRGHEYLCINEKKMCLG